VRLNNDANRNGLLCDAHTFYFRNKKGDGLAIAFFYNFFA
jgi:hypothetical protein